MYVQIGGVTLGGGYGTGPYGSGAYGAGLGSQTLFLTAGGNAQPIQIVDAINQRTTCHFHILDVQGTYQFPQGTVLSIYDDSNTKLFGGFVADCLETKPSMTLATLLHEVQGMDNHYLADKRSVPYVAAAGVTCGSVVQDLVTNWLASEGVTVGGIQAGPTLSGTVTYNYKPISFILDQMASFANYSWFIDQNKQLWFFAGATFTAPWTFDGTQPGTYDGGGGGASAGVSVEHYNKGYRNAQYVLGATEITSAQTEAHKGDGSTRAFPLGYPIHSQPTNVNVNGGAAQTVGVQGSTTGKQWYWTKGSNVLQQDSSGTILLSSDTLSVTYVGQYEVVAYSQDGAQISIEQTLEGGGTGIVEEATTDTKLTTAAQAFQEAAGLLGEYSGPGTILAFKTTKAGLKASQMLPVNLAWGARMVTGNFLIESVTYDYEPNGEIGVWWYTVRATQGPVSETWVQWFQRVFQPQASVIDVSSLGQQSQLALLQTTNETWTWTESVSETVTACFTFPVMFPKTFC